MAKLASVQCGFGIEGTEALAAKMRALDDKVQRQILARVMRKAGRPVVEDIRSATPVRTGAAKASIGLVVRNYRDRSICVMVAGARKEFGAKGKKFSAAGVKPFKYFHLVDQAVKGQPAYSARRGPHKRVVPIRSGRGSTSGLGFVEAARDRAAADGSARIASELASEIEAAL
jgi:hypothetical protein